MNSKMINNQLREMDEFVEPDVRAYIEPGAVFEEMKPHLFAPVSMAELMSADYRVRFLCRGVLAEGQPMIIGAPQKSFKTSLELELACCLATGSDFLGHFACPDPVRVCVFIGEGGLGVVQDTLRRIGKAKEIDISQIENFIVTDRVPRLDNDIHLEEVGRLLKKHKIRVAFFDPAYLALGGSEVSNVFSQGERLRAINDICIPLNCTPIVVHHLRKNRVNAYEQPTLEDLSMSGFAEFAGQWMLLSRREKYDPDEPVHRLWIAFGGRTGHGSAWGLDIFEGSLDDPGGRVWQTELRRQSEVRAAVTGESAQKKVEKKRVKEVEFTALCNRALVWIQGKVEGVTKRGLRTYLQIGDTKADQVLMRLEEDGAVESSMVEVKTGKSVREVGGYRAVDTDEKEQFFG